MIKDSNYKQELKKYDNPIVSREYILKTIKNKKLSHQQLVEIFDLNTQQKKPLINRLQAMVRDKQLSCNADGNYHKFSKQNLLTGEVIANPKGFGFIKLDKGGKDLRLSPKQMQICFHGDKIKACLLNNKRDAQIIKIISTSKNLVGRLFIKEKTAFVVVDDRRIKHNIEIKKLTKNYKNNTVVVVEITQSPTLKTLAQGVIIAVLGDFKSEGVEIKSALIRHQIPAEFHKESIKYVKSLPITVLKKDKINRKNLTHLPFITIDGNDSKDFDDAVFCKPHNNGWKLLVAIADVAHYVKEKTKLDEDALKRGNSVYFPRLVIPMLPEKLSNNLCSLNEKVERLVMICEMDINYAGNLQKYQFYSAVIFSHARLTYDFVGDFLINKEKIKTKKISENITNLYGIYQSLKIAREKRGVIDFDRAMSKIIFNDNGKIKNIIAINRNDAHKLIEECMLVANQSAALFLASNQESFLYRAHPSPTLEKIISTRKFLASIELELGGGDNPSSSDFAKTLKNAKGRADENIIKTIILRTMKQASYTQENLGHFGLAFTNYTHFTSPIRRYSDLLVHRAIKRVLTKKKVKNNNISVIGEHISMTERRADEATRDVEKWLKCEYMQDKLGKSFNGVISSVVNFGLFIELDDTFVEGLVAMRDLKDDYYLYDEIGVRLIGKASGKIYKLGDKIQVLLASVNLEDRQISLIIDD